WASSRRRCLLRIYRSRADPRRPPWVSSLDVPPLPPPLPPRPRMDFGRRVSVHADPAGPACTGITFRSVLRFVSGFFPTRPHGARAGVSRRRRLRAVAFGSRLLPSRPAKDFHLQSSAHARHTRPPSVPTPMRQEAPQPRQNDTYRNAETVQRNGASSRHRLFGRYAFSFRLGADRQIIYVLITLGLLIRERSGQFVRDFGARKQRR